MCSNYKDGNMYYIVVHNSIAEEFYNDPNLVFNKELVEYIIENGESYFNQIFTLDITNEKRKIFYKKLKEIGNIDCITSYIL
jgi:hypothetical protein